MRTKFNTHKLNGETCLSGYKIKLYTILIVNLLTNTLVYDGMGNRNLFG